MVCEGGNAYMHHLLAAKAPCHDAPADYREILRIKNTNLNDYKQWRTARKIGIYGN